MSETSASKTDLKEAYKGVKGEIHIPEQPVSADGTLTVSASEAAAADPAMIIEGNALYRETLKPWHSYDPSKVVMPKAIIIPKTEKDVQEAVRVSRELGLKIIPQGGNSALTGGATPQTDKPEDLGDFIILKSLTEGGFNIQKHGSNEATAQVTGNVTARMIEAARPDLKLPVDLGIGSQVGQAQVLGYLATNAAGSGAAFEGNALDMVKSLRVVDAQGDVQDITEPDEFKNYVGMAGTTGIIVGAEIDLVRKPTKRRVAALRVDDIGEMHDLLDACKKHGWEHLKLFERMNDELFQEVLNYTNRSGDRITSALNDLGRGDIVLIELGTSDERVNLDDVLDNILEEAGKKRDAVLSRDRNEADFMMGYRVVNASKAYNAYAEKKNGRIVAFDISIPPGDDRPFPSEELLAQLKEEFPKIKLFAFGHAAGVEKIDASSPRGGTAVHFNPVIPNKKGVQNDVDRIRDMVYTEVAQRGGTIAAEHTWGRRLIQHAKNHDAGLYKEMLGRKVALDPDNIFNPGAMFDPEDVTPAGHG